MYVIQFYNTMFPVKNVVDNQFVYNGHLNVFICMMIIQQVFKSILPSLYCSEGNKINISFSDIQNHIFY